MKDLFHGAGKSGVTAPYTLKTINKNANRGGDGMNERLRDYAGAPRPKGGKASPVTDYARMVKTGGDDDMYVKYAKRQTRTIREEPPMGDAESYDPMAMSTPEYNGSISNTPAAPTQSRPGKKVRY